MKYLVNRKTKEHQVMTLTPPEGATFVKFATAVWDIVQADSDGWIAHTGTECPLPLDCIAEFRAIDGEIYKQSAGAMVFGAKNGHLHITHYRPIITEKVQEPYTDDGTRPEPPPADYSDDLVSRLKAAHKAAQTIPDLEAELREVLAGMGYDLVARSPFANQCCCNPAQCWEPCGDLGKSESHVAVSPERDMSDWRNWREGDVLTCVKNSGCGGYRKDVLYTVKSMNDNYRGNVTTVVDSLNDKHNGDVHSLFRFHSRPAKGEK